MARGRSYRLIDHTADFGLEIWGRTLEELFCHAAEGMMTLLVTLPAVQAHEEQIVAVEGHDREELLVSWLNELLYRAEVEEFLARRYEILEMDERHLRARVSGETFDPDRHGWGAGIKAATYHDLHIERAEEGEWRVVVIFDT
ncbi:MAG: archease [Chloroflexia bacterium]|nr:archease [Chloroflexia bacterium]